MPDTKTRLARPTPAPALAQRKLGQRPVTTVAAGSALARKGAMPRTLLADIGSMGLQDASEFVMKCLAWPRIDDVEAAAQAFAARGMAHASTPGRADAVSRLVFRPVVDKLVHDLAGPGPLDALLRGLMRGLGGAPRQSTDAQAPDPVQVLMQMIHRCVPTGPGDSARRLAVWRAARAYCNTELHAGSVMDHVRSVFPLREATCRDRTINPLCASVLSEENAYVVRALAHGMARQDDALQAAFLVAVLPPEIHCDTRMQLMNVVCDAWATVDGGRRDTALVHERFQLMLRTLLTHPQLDGTECRDALAALAFRGKPNIADLDRLLLACRSLDGRERSLLISLLVEIDDEGCYFPDAQSLSVPEQRLLGLGDGGGCGGGGGDATGEALPEALRGELAVYWGKRVSDRAAHRLLDACGPEQQKKAALASHPNPLELERAAALAAAHLGLRIAQGLKPWSLSEPLGWQQRLLAFEIVLRVEPAAVPMPASRIGAWTAAIRSGAPRDMQGRLLELLKLRTRSAPVHG